MLRVSESGVAGLQQQLSGWRLLASRSISLLPFGAAYCSAALDGLLLVGGYGECYFSSVSSGGERAAGRFPASEVQSCREGFLGSQEDERIVLLSGVPGEVRRPSLSRFLRLPVSPLPSAVSAIDVKLQSSDSSGERQYGNFSAAFLLVQFQCGEIALYSWSAPPAPETLALLASYRLDAATSCPARFTGGGLSFLCQNAKNLELVRIDFSGKEKPSERKVLHTAKKPPVQHVYISDDALLLLMDGENPIFVTISLGEALVIDFKGDISPTRSLTCGALLSWPVPDVCVSEAAKTVGLVETVEGGLPGAPPFFLLAGFSDGEVAVFYVSEQEGARPSLMAFKLASRRLDYAGIDGLTVSRACGREYAFVRSWSDALHYIPLQATREVVAKGDWHKELMNPDGTGECRVSTGKIQIPFSMHVLYHTEGRVQLVAELSQDAMLCGSQDGVIDVLTFRAAPACGLPAPNQAEPRERTTRLEAIRNARRARRKGE